MYLQTTEQLVLTVAMRWKNANYHSNRWNMLNTPSTNGLESAEIIYKKLKALPPNTTKEDVADIIGNDSWASIICDECDLNCEAVMLLGEESNLQGVIEEDIASAFICESCLQKALSLIKKRR